MIFNKDVTKTYKFVRHFNLIPRKYIAYTPGRDRANEITFAWLFFLVSYFAHETQWDTAGNPLPGWWWSHNQTLARVSFNRTCKRFFHNLGHRLRHYFWNKPRLFFWSMKWRSKR